MTTKELATIAEHTPPYWNERAWQPDGRDEWTLTAMRAGKAHILESIIEMDILKNPELGEPVGREITHFRSNRAPIDGELVDWVMGMDLETVEKQALWRRDNTNQLDNYPRAVLDVFAQDIVAAVDEAGLWDRGVARRWFDAFMSNRALTTRWLE